MAKKGWLSIRNVPDIPSQPGENGLFQKLTRFFERNCLCPKCKGKGFTQEMDGPVKEDITTVRFGGIADLEKLNEMEGVPMGDTIRYILEKQCFQKQPCKLCHGSRFVTKKIKAKYKGQTKNKKLKKILKGKKRGKGQNQGKKADKTG